MSKKRKPERSTAASQLKLQKEVELLRKENETLKINVKQKDTRLAVLAANFDSSSISKNLVEAFDMENMFRQAAIDAQEHVQRLLKTIHIKPEDFEEVKAELGKTKGELTQARTEKAHIEKQLNVKKRECENLLEERRLLILKNKSLPSVEDVRTLENSYRCRIIALKDELKQKNSLLDQYTNRLPGILSKDHTSEEYQRLEMELCETTAKLESLSTVFDVNETLKTNILNLENEKEVLKECVKNLEKERNMLKVRLDEHVQFRRSLPPDATTAAVLQQQLVEKDLSLKRQHDDFVKQLNDMQDTVLYLRLQYDKHICVQNELERKQNELVRLKEELTRVTHSAGEKDQHIKDLESHFVIRSGWMEAFTTYCDVSQLHENLNNASLTEKIEDILNSPHRANNARNTAQNVWLQSGMQHTVMSLEKKIKSIQEELNDSKRTIAKLITENKKLSNKLTENYRLGIPVESVNAGTIRETKVESEFYKQQLLEEKQKLREEKRQHWKSNEKIKQLEITCHDAFENLERKEKEAQMKHQTQRILLERKDRTINELRRLSLSRDYASKLPKLKAKG